ncbi:hypothetical protein [Pseudolactococcus reticulitermitis]|uniref:Uncharacterized protein n=1 Tax=Pseudolactococcus reticulitermitis TaxID=2025039 RepID=A0A224XAT5_9LACT|nr:hypothetical protein [Lactococcus reticulitermitis]GAX46771.1 hypothetical protein RsY01_350 [Lactococcus reticulitermitis]
MSDYGDAALLIMDFLEVDDIEYAELLEKHPVITVYETRLRNTLDNLAGTEGETERSEGDVTRKFASKIIPDEIRAALKKYVKVQPTQKAVRF